MLARWPKMRAAVFGQFDGYGPPGNRNSGIRGLPPGFNPQPVVEALLSQHERMSGAAVLLTSAPRTGVTGAAMAESMTNLLEVVEEVTLWPTALGNCGAPFVGSNARHLDWEY
jgi:hypothetical protein